jgi:hypothetical protein
MRTRRAVTVAAILAAGALTPLVPAGLAGAAGQQEPVYGQASVPIVDQVSGGPWTLSEGGVNAVYPSANPLSSTTPPFAPYASGVAGTPGPLPDYCASGGAAPETGPVNSQPSGLQAMQPYYFPFVTEAPDGVSGHLIGYFDARPKDTDESIVVASSTDNGQTWTYEGTALEQNAGYCPQGDTNDDGQGHPMVIKVGGASYLYTVNRPSGDNVGVGLLVHQVNPSASNPLSGLNASEPVGVDPDIEATDAASVPTTGGATINVSSLGTTGSSELLAPGQNETDTAANSPEQIMPGQFEDLALTDPSASVITCTAAAADQLTGCTAPSAVSVSADDVLVQVLGDVTAGGSVPQGPNNVSGDPGAGGSTISLDFTDSPAAASFVASNAPGRVYIDGATVYCTGGTISGAASSLTNCSTTQTGGLTIAPGNAITTDPVVPTASQPGTGLITQTTGLVAPDGIVGVIPAGFNPGGGSPYGAPPNSTVVIYGEKILNYYIEGTTQSSVSLPAASFTMAASTTPTQPIPSSGPFSVYLGTNAGIQQVTCNGYALSAGTGTFSGCSGGTGSVSVGSDVGGPGAAIASSATLGNIGEGSTKGKTLFKNNEDYTALRAAYTTNGVTFTDLGIISGTDPANQTDVNNPASQAQPATADKDLPLGAQDNPELRYVGTRGTIILNADGTLGMFDSGAWQSDGDSDAFNQIFYTTSTDGTHWSTPVVVESTDYTFSARASAGAGNPPTNTSGYYSGRAYSPTVVQDPTTGALTLIFSGYSAPKPLPDAGSKLGSWTIASNDLALYRTILSVPLTVTGSITVPTGPGYQTPEAPAAVLLPLVALGLGGGSYTYIRRRRRPRGAAR